MPISRFPRNGHPIAPTLLRQHLREPIPEALRGDLPPTKTCLGDLDCQTWEFCSEEECDEFAELVVSQVRDKWSDILATVGPKWIAPPPRMSLLDLQLQTRTANCLADLATTRRDGSVALYGSLTIGEICGLPHFGAKSLVDLLTSLESTGVLGAGDIGSFGMSADCPSQPPMAETGRGVGAQGLNPSGFQLEQILSLRMPIGLGRRKLKDFVLPRKIIDALRPLCGHGGHMESIARMSIGQLMRAANFTEGAMGLFIQAVCGSLSDGEGGAEEVHFDNATRKIVFGRDPGSLDTTLEDELHRLTKESFSTDLTTSQRNIKLVERVFGFDGKGGCSLSVAGAAFGLSRERVRQICDYASRSFKTREVRAPILRRAVELIESSLPIPVSSLQEKLCAQQITRDLFKIEGIVAACKLRDRRVKFEIVNVGSRPTVVRRSQAMVFHRLVTIAEKMVGRFGAATIRDVMSRLRSEPGGDAVQDLSEETVMELLAGVPGFEVLVNESRWFWFGPMRRSRVLSRVHKIVTVAKDGIDVAALRSGVSRHYTMDGYSPPKRVLMEICRRLPGFSVDEALSVVKGPEELDWRKVLKGVEYSMVAVLWKNGGVLPRDKFEEICVRKGVRRATFYACLEYSPVLERLAPGVYGIRGVAVQPGLVESLGRSRRRSSVRVDHGWVGDATNGRRIWIAYCASEGLLSAGTASVPSELVEILQGEYSVEGESAGSKVKVVVKGGTCWGVGHLVARKGGEPGDMVVIEFDVEARSAKIRVGGEELLEEFQPESSDGEDDVEPESRD